MKMMGIYTFVVILIAVTKINSQGVSAPAPAAFAPQAPSPPGDCGYSRLSNLVRDEGSNIQSYNQHDYETCKSYCSSNSDCKSFSYCEFGNPNCHLKRKVIYGGEALKNKATCSTSYPKTCESQERTTCKKRKQSCGYAGNGEFYGSCCNNMECKSNSNGAVGGVAKCSRGRERCKKNGQSCGSVGNGENYGNCCNNMKCEYNNRPGGVGKCQVPPPCVDDNNWNDMRHGGNGNESCKDFRNNNKNWCNLKSTTGNPKWSAYSAEARRACPKACGVC